jgi:hypothetical protein
MTDPQSASYGISENARIRPKSLLAAIDVLGDVTRDKIESKV